MTDGPSALRRHACLPEWVPPALAILIAVSAAQVGADNIIKGSYGPRDKPLTHAVSKQEALRFRSRLPGKSGTLVTGHWQLVSSQQEPIAGTRHHWQVELPDQPDDFRFIPDGLPAGSYGVMLNYRVGAQTRQRRAMTRFSIFSSRWLEPPSLGGERLGSQTLSIPDAVDIPIRVRSRALGGLDGSRLSLRITGAGGRELLEREIAVTHAGYPLAKGHEFSLSTTALPLNQRLRWQLRLWGQTGEPHLRQGYLEVMPWPLTVAREPDGRICIRAPDSFTPPLVTRQQWPARELVLDAAGCATIKAKACSGSVIQLDSNGLRARGKIGCQSPGGTG